MRYRVVVADPSPRKGQQVVARRKRAAAVLSIGMATIVLGILAAPADAATVRAGGEVRDNYKNNAPDELLTTVVVTGDPQAGEDLTVSLVGGQVVVRSAAGAITATTGCVQHSPQEVRCVWDFPGDNDGVATVVTLGAGADHLRAEAEVSVTGGDGDDRLELKEGGSAGGGAGDDVITGGAGGLIADGGPGTDRITGGDGFDVINGGDGSDILDGAGGPDMVSWSGSAEAIRVDLTEQSGTAGPTRALDVISNFDSAEGGEGDDLLIGDRGRNDLYGNGGDDVLVGGDGDDSLEGGEGDDQLWGGSGNDSLYAGSSADAYYVSPTRASEADRLDGGTGNDFLTGYVSGARASHFSGGDGDDELSSAGIRDLLEGNSGADVLAGPGDLRGGSGADVLKPSGSRLLARSACGGGRDLADLANARKRAVPDDCESVFWPGLAARPTVVGRSLSLAIPGGPCDRRSVKRCNATLTVSAVSGGRLLGSVVIAGRRHPQHARISLARALCRPMRLRMRLHGSAVGDDFRWTARVAPTRRAGCPRPFPLS